MSRSSLPRFSAPRLSGCVSRLALAAVLVPSLVSLPAQAQDALTRDTPATSGPALTFDPIILTGEKRARSLAETAASVSVLSGEDLAQDSGDGTVSDVLRDVPNILYTSTVAAPIIRGQDAQGPNYGSTAFFGGTVPRASINLDGHYLSFNEMVFGATTIWDVNAIEVFRGPQTSTQGANSIAGAIIVNTNDPVFTPEGAVQLQYGSRNMRRASLMASGALSEDFAARISADFQARDNFVKFINPAYAPGATDPDFSYGNLRGKLLWRPSDLPGLEAKLTFSHTQANRPTGEGVQRPFGDLTSNGIVGPTWDQRANTTIADISYDFDNGITLHNQLQYTNLFVHRVMDPPSNGEATVDQENLSNELRVTFGASGDEVSGVLGLFTARTTSDDWLWVRGTSDFRDERNNLGIYGETSYRFADTWTITGGLRFQRDEIERSGTSNYAAAPLHYEATFSEWLPRLSIAHELAPGLTVGALASRGYNPGGVNLSFASRAYVEFDAETVNNYELFTRASLLDDRLIVTGNLFYSDYRNSQRQLPDYLDGVPYGSVVVNADRAKAYGLELEADYRVSDDLRLRGGLGLLQTEIGKFSSLGGAVYEGNSFGRSPGHMLSLGADWAFAPGWSVSGSLRHTGNYYSSDENIPAYRVGNYTVANARLSWMPRDNLELTAFVNNLFDERSPTSISASVSGSGDSAAMVEPREIGIGAKMTF